MGSVIEKHASLKSQCDKCPLDITLLIPNKKIKGIVQISHGMTEHKERYLYFMKYLTEKGYVTIINDHRGHGKSIRKKQYLGYFYDDKGEYIVEDLHQVTEYAKKIFPDYPITLFGHSMGSMIAMKYLKKYDQDIDKLILCGLPSKNSLTPIGLLVTNIIKLFKGDMYRSKLLNKLSFLNYNKNFEEHGTGFDWLCSVNEVVQSYYDDPMSGFIFTVNGFQNLYHLNIDIYSKKNWLLQNKELPILFIAGSEDPVIINEDKWKNSQHFLNNIGYKKIMSKLYPKLRHELLNETDRENIYLDIYEFIKAKQ